MKSKFKIKLINSTMITTNYSIYKIYRVCQKRDAIGRFKKNELEEILTLYKNIKNKEICFKMLKELSFNDIKKVMSILEEGKIVS